MSFSPEAALRENWQLAWEVRRYVQGRAKLECETVSYKELMIVFDLNRFRLGHVLDILMWIDTMLVSSSLWCAFIVYSSPKKDVQPGGVSQKFFDTAQQYGWKWKTKEDFINEQRNNCFKSLEKAA